MKKITLLFLLVGTLFLSSCRITKTLTMFSAKTRATQTETVFMQGKNDAVNFLKLEGDQKKKIEAIWLKEKKDFSEIKLENENIAPIVHRSELAFRESLTEPQLAEYLKQSKAGYAGISSYFLNDDQLKEIARIYLN